MLGSFLTFRDLMIILLLMDFIILGIFPCFEECLLAIVSLWRLTLNLWLQVETVEGSRDLQIPSGIQPGDSVKLSRLGVPDMNKPSIRGDHYFIVNVLIPKYIRSVFFLPSFLRSYIPQETIYHWLSNLEFHIYWKLFCGNFWVEYLCAYDYSSNEQQFSVNILFT